MSEILLAIDMGGSYTSIFRKDSGLVLKEPTLIGAMMTDNGYEVKVMGKEAKDIQGKTDERTVVFSPISEGVVKSIDYATILLKHFLDKVITHKNIFTKIKCLVPYPTGLSEEEKNDYKTVFLNVGINDVIFVPRLLCSAYGGGVNIFANSANMVIDIGGVSTDVGVINLGTLIDGATLCVGGKAIDAQIVRTVSSKYGVEIGLSSAQKLKEEIGSLYSNDTANMEVMGVDTRTKSPASVVVYATDVKMSVMPLLSEIGRIVETTLNILPPEISADVAKNGILITGGFSSIVGLERYLRTTLNLPIIIAEDAPNACILGAGKLLANLNELKRVLNEL
ncbi:MAG: rod shape-determining protein [Eubacteriales bacterium]|nr:rod shape-determining protein [Eubacteriales bacterium]